MNTQQPDAAAASGDQSLTADLGVFKGLEAMGVTLVAYGRQEAKMTRLAESITASIVAASVVLSGCASVKVARFDQVTRAPKAGVEVFTSSQAVRRPYKEIALITADQGEGSAGITDLTQKMIVRARALGADAVILLSTGHKPGAGVFIGDVYVPGNQNYTSCTAIVYTAAVAAPTSPEAPVPDENLPQTGMTFQQVEEVIGLPVWRANSGATTRWAYGRFSVIFESGRVVRIVYP